MAEKNKLSLADRADIVILRGMGYSIREISEKLNVAENTISYWLNKNRARAEKVGPHWAFLEVIMQAGPAYPIFKILKFKLPKKEV